MAKKRGRRRTNKSQAIRDYLQQDPGATPKQIVAALAERGIKVRHGSAALSLVLSSIRRYNGNC